MYPNKAMFLGYGPEKIVSDTCPRSIGRVSEKCQCPTQKRHLQFVLLSLSETMGYSRDRLISFYKERPEPFLRPWNFYRALPPLK